MDETLEKKDNYSLLRKSAFGRTNLFLTSSGVMLREIKSSSSSMSRLATASVYHPHETTKQSKPCKLCWHCCYDLQKDSTLFRLPRLYDPNEQVYHVYGWFCSPACTKGYILEHAPFDRGYQMNVFVRMLRQVYNITEPVVEAPPRIALKHFGGPFDIENFRKNTNVCSVITPPFVSYCMLIEERQPIEDMGETTKSINKCTVKGLRRPENSKVYVPEDNIGMPQEQSLYSSFLKNNAVTEGSSKTCEKSPTRKRQKKRRRKQARLVAWPDSLKKTKVVQAWTTRRNIQSSISRSTLHLPRHLRLALWSMWCLWF